MTPLVITLFLLLQTLLSPPVGGGRVQARILKPARPIASTPKSAAPTRFLMAHYMPWYEAAPERGKWGWHWTMNHYDPNHAVQGRREAASQFQPLIGLYDSNDPDLLECHVLLMKFAGIDGVIIDWYGSEDYLDYGLNHRNTQHLIQVIRRAGLHFAVCYEDQTVPKLIAGHRFPADEAVAQGQKLLKWMEANWFSTPQYLKLQDRPVLMVFGGGYYQGDQWKQIFAPLHQPPAFFTELGPRPSAVGAFGWPVPAGGTEKSFEVLNDFYSRSKAWAQSIPVAYPRFQDIYADAGVGPSWGKIEDREGKTYEETLTRALRSSASIVQLATWNDWGEGTNIEPSVEFGYRDLEATQRLRRKYIDPKFLYTAKDLRLPIRLYLLQKRYSDNPTLRAKFDAISKALFEGRLDRSRTLLEAVSKVPDGRRPSGER